MALGQLDRRITIQSQAGTQDEFGQSVDSWSDVATVWAQVKFKAGSESVSANKLTTGADCIFTIRYRSQITTRNRIIYEGEYYDIIHKAEIGRRKYMDLTAKKVQ